MQIGTVMRRPIRFAWGLIRKEEGITAIEYALVALLIAMGIVVGVSLVGLGVSMLYDGMGAAVEGIAAPP
jgi:Flp pilus assembly pilin Flp